MDHELLAIQAPLETNRRYNTRDGKEEQAQEDNQGVHSLEDYP